MRYWLANYPQKAQCLFIYLNIISIRTHELTFKLIEPIDHLLQVECSPASRAHLPRSKRNSRPNQLGKPLIKYRSSGNQTQSVLHLYTQYQFLTQKRPTLPTKRKTRNALNFPRAQSIRPVSSGGARIWISAYAAIFPRARDAYT